MKLISINQEGTDLYHIVNNKKEEALIKKELEEAYSHGSSSN